MDWSAENRPHKEAIRFKAFSGYQQREGAVILPGWDESSSRAGLCVRAALDVMKVAPEITSIDKTKPLFCAEYDPFLSPKIARNINALGFEDVRFHSGDLAKLVIDSPIDFAFIDLCGSLKPNLLRWLATSSGHLIDGGMLSFTMLMSARGNEFIFSAFYAMINEYREIYMEMRETFRVVKPQIIVPLFLLRCALRDFDFDTEIVEYRDTTSMMFIRLLNASRTTTDWPELEDVLKVIANTSSRKKPPVKKEKTIVKPLHAQILSYLSTHRVSSSESIRKSIQGFTPNEISFGLVELQNENLKRGRGGNGKGAVVKLDHNPSIYSLRSHIEHTIQ